MRIRMEFSDHQYVSGYVRAVSERISETAVMKSKIKSVVLTEMKTEPLKEGRVL
jgi:hypothetical protein